MSKNDKRDVKNVDLKSENFSAPDGIWEGNVYDNLEEKRGTKNSVLGGVLPGGYNPEYLEHNTKKEGLGPNTKR